jgi:hypothetical protein
MPRAGYQKLEIGYKGQQLRQLRRRSNRVLKLSITSSMGALRNFANILQSLKGDWPQAPVFPESEQ